MATTRRVCGQNSRHRSACVALSALFVACTLISPTRAAKSKTSHADELLYLTDDNLDAALSSHPRLLLNVNVPGCAVCDKIDKSMRKAAPELRLKTKGAVKLGRIMLDQNAAMPHLAQIVQGNLELPKLIVFREGEALDYTGADFSKEQIVTTMLREASRDTVATLTTVKVAERFLHLDSWSAQHADEEKPARVVGFFASNTTAAYRMYRATALKLQGLIAFGECFDAALQKKFLGAPTKRAVIQIVKADKRERKLTYKGSLATPPLARWIATHSMPLVQDLSTESSVEALMAIGVPVFLLLMPDSYEEELGEMLKHFRTVAATVREQMLFGYGFKDTAPWPDLARQLGIPSEATGAYWLVVNNNQAMRGRNWSNAWLRPPTLGFQVLGLDARGDETVEDVTEEKVQEFVGAFLKHVEEREAPQETWEAVIEEVEEEGEGETASAASAAPAGGSEAKAPTETSQAVSDKALRKLLGTLTMDFNSGMANLKKALDDLTDTPHLIPSKAPALTQLLGSLELKVKKDMLQVKRELMDLGKRKDEL